MGKVDEFIINIMPFEAAELIKLDSLVHKEFHELNGSQLFILVFEKFYFRTSSYASLTVVLDNFKTKTSVRLISSGSGEGIFGIDWGSGSNFINSVKKILHDYTIY